jgi:preprotein translocase subunit SecG
MLILTGILFFFMIFISIPLCCYNKEKETTEEDQEEQEKKEAEQKEGREGQYKVDTGSVKDPNQMA